MSTETNETTVNPQQILAECLRDSLALYLALLEGGSNKGSYREMGKTVRFLAQCLQETTLLDLPDDDDDGTEAEFEEELEEEN